MKERFAAYVLLLATVLLPGVSLWAQQTQLSKAVVADSIVEPPLVWGDIDHRGNAWVTPLSCPARPTAALQGRHIAIWASHGKYYDLTTNVWRWQRPRIYCTTEDLLTQSFVWPLLVPMLENAGAIVFSPRERDPQRNEVIVDNDFPQAKGIYQENQGAYEWQEAGTGFCQTHDVYQDFQNPFTAGTCRMVDAQPRKRQLATALWQPTIPEEGDYAVYVSYASFPNSVIDAQYTVWHSGMPTRFRVNQRMGGGTWVYLGTFHFQAGCSTANCVQLSNLSNYRGVVTADAVRFGGGMGNIARSDSLSAPVRSGLPRYLESARYSAQWYGMPYRIYGTKDSQNDYAEDLNSRSLTSNFLAGGSCYLPTDTGLCVPIELSLAVHSDAGYRPDSSLVGTLGIHTTGKYTKGEFEGLLAEGLFPSGVTRLTSYALCDSVMTQVCSDLTRLTGSWPRRELYDRNYSETRLPRVPSMILEMFSHQNWADLLRAHDPTFKFHMARAIYKGLLRFTASMHGLTTIPQATVVQPLPVHGFAALLDAVGDSVTLTWQPTHDLLEPTAEPQYYILYIAEGDCDFDNGQQIFTTAARVPMRRGTLMRFRIAAANGGGQSLLSEELCAYSSPRIAQQALIVNAFDRLAAPQPIDNDSLRGFDIQLDPGVVRYNNPTYCGRQQNFQKTAVGDDLGRSGNELEGINIAGNTFDYPTRYARDLIAMNPGLSLSSCSRDALKYQNPVGNDLVVVVFGAQRQDGYSMQAAPCFTPPLTDFLAQQQRRSTSILTSGAYLSEEAAQGGSFTQDVLHWSPAGVQPADSLFTTVQGMGTALTLDCQPNELCYSTRRLSILAPAPDAFCTMLYGSSGASSSVAYQSDNYRTMSFGFPLEMIREADIRRGILGAALQFLLPPKQ